MLGGMSDIRPHPPTGRSAALCFALMVSFGLCACAPTAPEAAFDRLRGVRISIDEQVVLECAPFARVLSGLQLNGAAADWWRQAEGRYARSNSPAVGGVLVFRRSARLADGHVAVVSRVLSDRQILVTQANWVRHRVIADMPVIDVSPENDWTLVRVWWPPSGQMGITAYPAYGFILANRSVSPDQIAADTPTAIRVAAALP